MKRKSTRVKFKNQGGETLIGVFERPVEHPIAHAIFTHCFTCGKDLKAIVKLSRKLAEAGVAVLRFDFTGLNDSQGDFSETNLSSNIADVLSAVEYLRQNHEPPSLLIGHSLGGTAMTLAANRIESAKALVTIASPSSTQRLAGFLEASNPDIVNSGAGQFTIGGREFVLKQQLLDDLRSHDIESALAELRVPILMYHSPDDKTLPYDWGLKMFNAARGVKNFITLDGADHLLTDQPEDLEFVAETLLSWGKRYLQR